MRASHRVFNKDDPKAHFDFCTLPDCVFLSEKGGCNRLNVSKCTGIRCTFMQSEAEYKSACTKSAEKWQRRINSLDESVQRAIAKKYYGGSMPWQRCDYSNEH